MQKDENNEPQDQCLLPPPTPPIDKSYSLEPDMAFGWTPKFPVKGPVPISFHHELIDHLIYQQLNSRYYPVIYLGFRPASSLQMHEVFLSLKQYEFDLNQLFPSKYKHLVNFYRNQYLKVKPRAF